MGIDNPKHAARTTTTQSVWKKAAVGLSALSLLVTGLFALQSVTAPVATAGSKVSIDSKGINGYDKTFFVNDARDIADSDPGDGMCATSEDLLGEKSCTLYAAIQEANAWTKANPTKSVLITPAPKIRDTVSGEMKEKTAIYLNWGTASYSGNSQMQKAQNPYGVKPMVDGKAAMKAEAGSIKGGFNEMEGATYLLDGNNITLDLQNRLQTTTDEDGPTRATFLLNGNNIKLRNASKVTSGVIPIVVGQKSKNSFLENITLTNLKFPRTFSPDAMAAETGVLVVGGADGTTFSNIHIKNMYYYSIAFAGNQNDASKKITNTTIDKMFVESNDPGWDWIKNYRAITTIENAHVDGLTIKNSIAHNMSSTDSWTSGYRAAIWFEDGTVDNLNIVNNQFIVDDVPSSYPPNPLSIMMKAKGSNWNISDNTFDWTYPGLHQGSGWDTWESWINIRPETDINRVTIRANKINGLVGTGPALWILKNKIGVLNLQYNTFINVGANYKAENPIGKGKSFELDSSTSHVTYLKDGTNLRTVHPTKVVQEGDKIKVTIEKMEDGGGGVEPQYPITVDFYTGTSKEPGFKQGGYDWWAYGKFIQQYIGSVTINSAAELASPKVVTLDYAGDMTNHRRIRVQTTDATGNSSMFSRASEEASNQSKAIPRVWIKRMGYMADGTDGAAAQPKTTFRRFMNFQIYTSVPSDPETIRKAITFRETNGNPHLVPNTKEYRERGVYGFLADGVNLVSDSAQSYRFAVECDDNCVVNPYIPEGVFQQKDDPHKFNTESNSTRPPANFVGDVADISEAEGNTVTFENPLQSSTIETKAEVTEGDLKPGQLSSNYLKINIRNRYETGPSAGQVVYTPVSPLKLKIVPINDDGLKDEDALLTPDPLVNKVRPPQRAKDAIVMTGISPENGFDKNAIMRTYTRDYTLGLDPLDNTVVDGVRHARYALDVESEDVEFRGLKLAAGSGDGSRAVTAPITVTIPDNDQPVKANTKSATTVNDQVADGEAKDKVIITVRNKGTKVRQEGGGVTDEPSPQPVSNARVTITVPDDMKAHYEEPVYKDETSAEISSYAKKTAEAGESFTLISNNQGQVTYSLTSTTVAKDIAVPTKVETYTGGTGDVPEEATTFDVESKVTFVSKPIDFTKSYFNVDKGDKKAGLESHTVTVVLKDKDGGPIKGLATGLTGAVTGLDGAKIGAFTESKDTPGTYTASVTSDKEGEATVSVKVAPDEQPEAKPLSVKKDDGNDKAKFIPGVEPVDAAKSTFEVTTGGKPADGKAEHTVTIQLNDAAGKPTQGRVNLTTLPGGPTFGKPTNGKADGDGFTSDENGKIVVPIVSEKAGTFTVRPTVEGKAIPKAEGKGDTATFTVGDPAVGEGLSNVTITDGWKKPDGKEKQVMTVTLKDAKGNPITGKTAITDFGLANGTPAGVAYAAPVERNGEPGVYDINVTSTQNVNAVNQTVNVSGVEIGSVPIKFKKIDPPTVEKANKGGVTGKAPGTAEGSEVTVTYDGKNGDTCTAKGTTDAAGNFTVAWDSKCEPKDGGNVSVTVKDKDSEVSSDPTTTTADVSTPPTPTINPTNGTSISGKAESQKDKPLKAGSKVRVTIGTNEPIEVAINDNGSWSVPAEKIPGGIKDGDTVKAEVVSPSGNVSDPVATTTVDKTPTKAPTVDKKGDKVGPNQITGSVPDFDKDKDAGSTVTVTYTGNDGKEKTATAKVGDDGKFTVPLAPPAKDGTEVSVVVTDQAGNDSTPTTATVDASQPTPTLNNLGTDKKATGTAEKGSTVVIYGPDGTEIARGKANDDGKFEITIPDDKMPKDGQAITAKSIDGHNNVSDPANAVVDLTPPGAATVNPTNGKTVSGTTSTEKGKEATEVVVTIDGKEVTVPVGPGGDWSVPAEKLKELFPATNGVVPDGKVITARAKDSANNLAPKPDTTKPDDKSWTKVDGTASLTVTNKAVNIAKNPVTGTTEPGSKVKIYKLKDDGTIEKEIGDATVNDKGEWTFSSNSTAMPDGKYGAQAKDPVGNLSTPVPFTVDTKAPKKPEIQPTNDGKSVTGKAEPGSEAVVIKDDAGNVVCKVPVGAGGNFKIEFGKEPCKDLKPQNGDKVKIAVEDAAGNRSEVAESTVDTSNPTLTVNPANLVKTDAKTISGTTDGGLSAGARTVTVQLKDKAGQPVGGPKTATVDPTTGAWTLDGTDWKKPEYHGYTLEVTATNTSTSPNKTTVHTTTLLTKEITTPTANPSNGYTVTGTGEPGTTISIKGNGESTDRPQTAVVDEQGNWTITLPNDKPLPEGEFTITAKDGVRDPQTGTGTADRTAPSIVVPSTNNGKEITVTTKDTDVKEIVVKDDKDKVIPGTSTKNPDGSWTWKPTNSDDMPKDPASVKVSAKDNVGNESPSQTSKVDTTAPDLTLPKDAPKKANGETPVVVTTEPNAEVTMTYTPKGSTEAKTVTVKANDKGKATLPFSEGVPEDGSTITINAKDAAGNTTKPDAQAPKQTITLTADTTKPEAPTVKVNKEDKKTVSGTAEKGASVEVCVTKKSDGKKTCKTVKADPTTGAYSTNEVGDIAEGDLVSATTIDEAGNKSPQADLVADYTDPSDPTIEVSSTSPKVVKGTGEPGSTVTVCVNDVESTCKTATVDKDGNYKVELASDLKTGDKVSAQATDDAGNTSKKVTKDINFTKPSNPTNLVANDKSVTGEVANCAPEHVGDKVIVKDKDGKAIGEGKVGADCKFNVKYYDGVKPKNGDDIKVQIVDKDDPTITSDEETTKADLEKPVAPTVDITKGNKGDKVKVHVNEEGGTLTVRYQDEAGKWQTIPADDIPAPVADPANPGTFYYEVPLPVNVKEGDATISVTLTDKAGNTSDPGTGKVDRTNKEVTINEGNGTSFSGTGEPGATVTIKYTGIDGQQHEKKIVVGEDGKFDTGALENPAAPNENGWPVTSEDAAGNKVEGKAVVHEKQPVDIEVKPTNGKKVTVHVDPAKVDPTKPDALKEVTVSYKEANGTKHTVTVPLTSFDKDGNATIELNPPAGDSTLVVVNVTDKFGNTGKAKEKVDGIAPEKPAITSATEKELKGTIDKSEAGGTVKVYNKAGEVIGEGTVNSDGSFTVEFKDGKKPADKEMVTVTVTDKAGNESPHSDPIEIDGSARLTSPDVAQDGKHVSGTADPGATIQIKDENGKVIGEGTAGPDGKFNIQLTRKLTPGETVEVSATDGTGHTDTRNVKYDPVKPSDPTVDTTDPDGTVSGTGQPGSIITVCVNGNARCETTSVGADGKFTLTIKGGLKAGDSVKVWATDPVSGVSSKVMYYTLKFEPAGGGSGDGSGSGSGSGSGNGSGNGSGAGHGKLKPVLAKTGADSSLLITLMLMLLISGGGALTLAYSRRKGNAKQ